MFTSVISLSRLSENFIFRFNFSLKNKYFLHSGHVQLMYFETSGNTVNGYFLLNLGDAKYCFAKKINLLGPGERQIRMSLRSTHKKACRVILCIMDQLTAEQKTLPSHDKLATRLT
jgi:hypothetical protein